MHMLEVTDLRKSYGDVEVLRGVSLSLARGECYGLLGPNGAGKTTTLRACLGLVEPDAGSISLLGLSVPTFAREARLRLGVVSQTDNLDPDFTVVENLLVYGRYFGIPEQTLQERIPRLLEFSELAARADSKMLELSGGMKRRLTLARALINDPDLVFLDEPTTGLDPQARHVIWDRMKQLLARGKTILLTTHFMDEAERLCSRLSIMDDGRIISTGSPQELIARHIEPEVLEVYGEGTQQWVNTHASLADRVESAGDTVFCYLRHAEPLIATLENRPSLRYLHRRANLEDVFLKLTGRDLRD